MLQEMMKILYTGDTVDNLKDTDVSPGLWGVIPVNNWTKILILFLFYYHFAIIYMKLKKDESRELKEANKAYEKGHLQNTCLLPN